MARHGAAGLWWSAVNRADWPKDPDLLADINAKMEAEFGDRRQELVFIGIDLDEGRLRGRLDACLLTDAEMARGRKYWKTLPDPFPRWRIGE
jgi:G3E family GTPase